MSTRGYVGCIHKGKIRGWFNHWDSYPSSLGKVVLECFKKHTQAQIREFFLENLNPIPEAQESDVPLQARSDGLLKVDWSKKTKVVLDPHFYKDGLFCEYTYLFNLDPEDKELLLFKGFGKKPSKGYEDWFTKGHEKKDQRFYNTFQGTITAQTKKPMEEMEILMDRNTLEVRNTPKSKLPLLVGKYDADTAAGRLLAKRIKKGE